jgi:hypothetical protein
MAKLTGNIQFTGSLGNVSAYTMRGSDKVILRTKGGASREKIKNNPAFARTRELNKEWSGCSKAGAAVRMAMYPLRHMADYNISGPLNAIAKIVQKLDTDHPVGSRAIYFSKHKQVLDGFNLNHQNTLDSVVRSPINFILNRNEGATVHLPALNPKINFLNKYQRPLFRFVTALGIISDMEYNEDYLFYRPLHAEIHGHSVKVTSDWYPALLPFDGLSLKLSLKGAPDLNETDTLILAAGIEFGNPLTNSIVEPIKYSGSAKILATF